MSADLTQGLKSLLRTSCIFKVRHKQSSAADKKHKPTTFHCFVRTKPFPKEENKSLAQTYFEYRKETSTAVASLSWKMHAKTTLFQTERVYD